MDTPSTLDQKPQQKPTTHIKWAVFFLIISLLGFVDSTYLAVKKLSGSPVTCTIVHGCDTVTSSSYSEIFGIPVALFGSLFYLAILVLSIAYLDKKKERLLSCISKLTWIGLFASIYFMVVQSIILHAYCIYCIGSAITSTLLFITGMTYLKKNKMTKIPLPPEQTETI
ncbi:MAG: hypothetical protein COU32_01165 [Candidatus Magasanikbacteria bacterium CG10_big_fil_rev_8_21_14_0_10_42_10]|uniref:Vitamin K epoxide reductase domain-containing protein n=2 Tax=Candidatus Magasanikiibacteriota TaxID=1752731 RepID=A0A2H0TWU2_9BACT|nr:MAG: hypothetical protein COU32_01165 [Candidatus Magasanikbacteria bacterium CG10_big_fil_rev_8_21_14_0_10_42_10]PIZ93957.1 MAG: hypothetical protein COX82_01685 [Candidatus Magasanikbacteria bacterium CG_4_10_14_0_2_um_filter_41_10]